MEMIATDYALSQTPTVSLLATMLESYECPAILVSSDYQILATNQLYKQQFGEIDLQQTHRCYEVSHGYSVPCDQAGEDCPLSAARESGHKERVLHIHQTPRGKEHVDVEMIPILDKDQRLLFFVELLKPVPLASHHSANNPQMVGKSPAFNHMLENIARVGKTDASVLLLGESGTGKELAARSIHMASTRKDKPLVTLECAGLSDTLFESELFGHVKGAFTGAHIQKKGLAEQANGGTLFLDEVGDIPLSMQVKLLRLLESGTFRQVGGTEVKTTNFRLICATHKHLACMVKDGSFRQDLYYRINVFPISLPSLLQRKEDIPLIAKTLLAQISPNKKYHLTQSAVALLQDYEYFGNIRELRNLLQRAIILSDTNMIDEAVMEACFNSDVDRLCDDQISESVDVPSSPRSWSDLKTAEEKYLKDMLHAFAGDRKKVAETAGISLRSLYRKLKEQTPK